MTEIGETFHRHCLAMIAEAEAALEAASCSSQAPSCWIGSCILGHRRNSPGCQALI
jgi:DNA-binding transcriptional LysR family regulator